MTSELASAELPPGWALTRIESIIPHDGIFSDGNWVESKDQDPNGDVRLIQLADVGDGVFRNRSARFLTSEKATELRCTYLRKGDILIARMPDPLGRACVFPLGGDQQFVTVVDVCVVRTDREQVDRTYLCHVINFLGVRKQVEDLQTGTTRKRISRRNLATVQIPLAPIGAQRLIATKIDELYSELEAGIESLRKARARLATYRKAVLKHAFEGKLTAHWREENKEFLETPEQLLAAIKKQRSVRYEKQLRDWETALEAWEEGTRWGRRPAKPRKPREIAIAHTTCEVDTPSLLPYGWRWVRLCNVAEVSGGLTKNPKRNALPRKMKYLRVANVCADGVLTDDIHKIGVTDAEARSVVLNPGDLLVVEGNGSIEQIGRVAMWQGELHDCGHQNHLIRVRKATEHDPRFALRFLLSPLGRDLITNEASSTSGLHTLSISKVENLPVPVASIAEEAEVVLHIDRELSVVDELVEEIEAQLAKSRTLRQSILKRAFSGQLVLQDDTDEAASVVLDRIRAEREQLTKRTLPRTGKRKMNKVTT